jgi:MOSC domain-containing protein YiiM
MRDGRHIDFGVYADVVTPGPIRRGDPVRVD